MPKKHTRLPVVIDKHIAGDVVRDVLKRRPINASLVKPHRPYRGRYADDEDISHVLQLGWENEVAVITADVSMIDKARRFERQLPKAESCLRGVLIVPVGKDEQRDALRRFVEKETNVIPTRSGDATTKTLDDIENYNVGVDLRLSTPRVVHLCDCTE
jgi:hypothetical protein